MIQDSEGGEGRSGADLLDDDGAGKEAEVGAGGARLEEEGKASTQEERVRCARGWRGTLRTTGIKRRQEFFY